MKIVLYKNSAEKNVVDKSESLSKVCEIEGVFKSATSVTNPSVIFDNESSTFEEYSIIDSDSLIVCDAENAEISAMDYILNNLLSANYAYIEDLSRYYFIEDITVVTDRLFEISMKVDVLMSFNEEIRANSVMVARSEGAVAIDCTINDDAYSFGLEKVITFQNFDDVWEKAGKLDNVGRTEFTPFFPTDETHHNIIISYVTTANLVYPDDSWNIYAIPAKATGANLSTQYQVIDYELMKTIGKKIGDDSTLESFVKNFTIYPFDIAYGEDKTKKSFYIGNDSSKTIAIDELRYPYFCVATHWVASFVPTYEYEIDDPLFFTCYPPYTTYELFIPYYGFVNLDPDDFMNKLVRVRYVTNYDDGTTTAFITVYQSWHLEEGVKTWDNDIDIWSQKVQLGVKPSLSSTNRTIKNNSDASIATNYAIQLISSILMTGAGLLTSQPWAVVGGIGGMISSTVKAGVGLSSNNVRGSVVLSSDLAGIYSNQNVFLRITKRVPKNPLSIGESKGYILNDFRELKAMYGFTSIDNSAHLSIPSATKSELDEIETLAKEGIIL